MNAGSTAPLRTATVRRFLFVGCCAGLPLLTATAAPVATTFVPVGGGYTDASLRGFARIVAGAAQSTRITILVIPAAYGDEPDERRANLSLAQERSSAIEAACRTVTAECSARLVPVLDRADAMDPANGTVFSDPTVAGVFFLGGDQDAAMRILAGSPIEVAMKGAYLRGVVFGGTSAGDSLESRNMVAGYAAGFDRNTALERNAVSVWWADNPDRRRGLDFGLPGVLLDQHFYQRGRFARLINMVAESADHYRDSGLLGIGLDYGTGVRITSGKMLSDVFGASSIAIVDFRSADAQFHWAQEPGSPLSARRILTQILAPDPRLSYSLATREPRLEGHAVPYRKPSAAPACRMNVHNSGELILLGGSYDEPHGRALAGFVKTLQSRGIRRLVIIAVGFQQAGGNNQVGHGLLPQLQRAGWSGSVTVWRQGGGLHDAASQSDELAQSGVLLIGRDAPAVGAAVADGGLAPAVRSVIGRAPVVMTNDVMTAALGATMVDAPHAQSGAIPELAIESFRARGLRLHRGIGVFEGMAFVPDLLSAERWGELYSLAKSDRQLVVTGLGSDSRLVVRPAQSGAGAHCPVIEAQGTGAVISLDGRGATFLRAANGSFSALNVLMNVYAPGDRLFDSN